jgi:hypothetical protein
MIWARALVCLALGACGDSIELRPPVTITQTLKPGETIECEGSIVHIGLPTYDFQVIGFATRKWSCSLRGVWQPRSFAGRQTNS